MDFTNSAASVVVVRVSTRCSITHYSRTNIWTVTTADYEDGIATMPLPDFGSKSCLSSLVCDIQILNMLTADGVYEYPLRMTRSAFLLEWDIPKELLREIQTRLVLQQSEMSFDSPVFYNMFKLCLCQSGRNQLALGIQLMALPINRPNKDQGVGLNTKGIISETRTQIKKKFDAVFDYSLGCGHC